MFRVVFIGTLLVWTDSFVFSLIKGDAGGSLVREGGRV